MLALGYRNLPPAVQGAREARYAKYFEDSPLGPPHFFLARDAQSDSFVGMSAIFPTQLRVFGELVPAAVAGEFAVDDGHRGLGPAVPLQRAAVNALGEHGLACAFGYPNEHSEPITQARRLRRPRPAHALREGPAKPHPRRAVRPRPGRGGRGAGRARPAAVGVLARAAPPAPARVSGRAAGGVRRPFLGGLGDHLAPGHDHERAQPRAPQLEVRDGRERGASTGPSRWSARTSRSPAYAVYRERNGIRHVIDIVFEPSQDVLDALLAELIRDARKQGAIAISLIHLGVQGLLTQRLRAFGFVRRTEESSLHVYVPGESELEQALDRGRQLELPQRGRRRLARLRYGA